MAKRPRKPKAPAAELRRRARAIHQRLSAAIPSPHVELKFGNPWELLVAVILSAQSTDKMVNKVMPELLARWPSPAALAAASQGEVEVIVKSTGFFRNKAKAIREMSRMLVERHDGMVPRNMEEMVELHGVARKTANVVLGAAYGVVTGITVDTHATRLSQRLKLTREKDPVKIESALCALFPRDEWIRTGHRFVLYGRHVCIARKPRCVECPLNELCPGREAKPAGRWPARAEAIAREMASRAEGFRSADASDLPA